MADERFVVMTVECQHCKTQQKVHIAASTGGAQMRDQTIRCLNCPNHFRITVPAKIVAGPFPAYDSRHSRRIDGRKPLKHPFF
jgi:hypothetical protein